MPHTPGHQLGAHEIMELHEVLSDTINGINQFQMYREYCQDPELRRIIDNQVHFMTNEYNTLVNLTQGKSGEFRTNHTPRTASSPTYGLQNQSSSRPNASVNQMNDRDIANGMLGCHKTTASFRMNAALEIADRQIREAIIQGAKNSADQAYEVWSYMNSKGYYQVPTFDQQTSQQIINAYQPAQTFQNQQHFS
ncbi:coat F domain-containing protein [Melghiribacillus thermohalophilus]|uniref:Coat F domain-containing protein n=1 Tax=Melghiribacillus thermohalophilus TaxID=1324956 RepID=A0A4R3NCP1_9BACI|nr:spore coat protein [Melghiribacillus thermohalophilus]TCT26660.1 coat F domain-containing protein [Melghiribacillus thermohalophilus]